MNAYQLSCASCGHSRQDVFISKISSSGSVLGYSSYLGGNNYETGYGIAIDSNRCAYISGNTDSQDFPLSNPYQGVYGGGTHDAFVAKLSSSGSSLIYSTYLGGSLNDDSYSIDIDSNCCSYISGSTDSLDFPTKNSYQALNAGSSNAFITKLSSAGSDLHYSTYLGGDVSGRGSGIFVDSSNYAYITGSTSSENFPTKNPYQSSLAGGGDSFAIKLSTSGSSIVYSTYLGGDSGEGGKGVVVGSDNCAYIVGNTLSMNYPTQNPYQSHLGGGWDVTLTKISSSGSSIIYSTYLGGGNSDYGNDLAINLQGCIFVTGFTGSNNFPVKNPYQSTANASDDIFITKFFSSGSQLVYSTYLGTSETDWGYGIDTDDLGYAYITGMTRSVNFPIVNPYQSSKSGESDAFVTKLKWVEY